MCGPGTKVTKIEHQPYQCTSCAKGRDRAEYAHTLSSCYSTTSGKHCKAGEFLDVTVTVNQVGTFPVPVIFEKCSTCPVGFSQDEQEHRSKACKLCTDDNKNCTAYVLGGGCARCTPNSTTTLPVLAATTPASSRAASATTPLPIKTSFGATVAGSATPPHRDLAPGTEAPTSAVGTFGSGGTALRTTLATSAASSTNTFSDTSVAGGATTTKGSVANIDDIEEDNGSALMSVVIAAVLVLVVCVVATLVIIRSRKARGGVPAPPEASLAVQNQAYDQNYLEPVVGQKTKYLAQKLHSTPDLNGRARVHHYAIPDSTTGQVSYQVPVTYGEGVVYCEPIQLGSQPSGHGNGASASNTVANTYDVLRDPVENITDGRHAARAGTQEYEYGEALTQPCSTGNLTNLPADQLYAVPMESGGSQPAYRQVPLDAHITYSDGTHNLQRKVSRYDGFGDTNELDTAHATSKV